MELKNIQLDCVGIIGLGSFGTAIANLIAQNTKVLVYVRNNDTIEQYNNGQLTQLHKHIQLTNNIEEITQRCQIIFPLVPASQFRIVMKAIGGLLSKHHIIIHGVKGLDISWPATPIEYIKVEDLNLSRSNVKTMSEVIFEETPIVHSGCISGPNLASELSKKQLAATVIASKSQVVGEIGKKLLSTEYFQVHTSSDVIGTELCGVLKNIIAIGAGMLRGLGQGENAKALFITYGLIEMVHIGKALGGTVQPFLGLSGIGDLTATCSSELSRNFQVGYQLAQGITLSEVLKNMQQVAEGIKTVKAIKPLLKQLGIKAPITEIIYHVLFEDLAAEKALQHLMKHPVELNIDFLASEN